MKVKNTREIIHIVTGEVTCQMGQIYTVTDTIYSDGTYTHCGNVLAEGTWYHFSETGSGMIHHESYFEPVLPYLNRFRFFDK